MIRYLLNIFVSYTLISWLIITVLSDQVARCTKIINADTDDAKYVINVKQFAKFVVDLGDQVAPTDIEEGMRVGYEY